MYSLNDKTKSNIFKRTGLSVEDILDKDFEDIDRVIEKKIGRKLIHSYSSKSTMFTGRGNTYLYLSRVLEKEAMERELKHI